MITLLWHVWRKGHAVYTNRHISVPSFDHSSRGWLWKCECGHTVAR